MRNIADCRLPIADWSDSYIEIGKAAVEMYFNGRKCLEPLERENGPLTRGKRNWQLAIGNWKS